MIDDELHKFIVKKGFIKKQDIPSAQERQTIGKYRTLRLLGKGGLGDVYLAEDTVLNRPVALKVLIRVGEQDLARFQREALLTAKLTHPNIVRIYEIAEHDNIHYISMQYIEGESLDRKNLTTRQKIESIRQIALALDHAHSLGIIHRDVKPANILIDKEGRPYLTDFGIAKQVSMTGARSNISVSGMIIGTPSYMSPEQAKGEIDKVDYLSDVYSLGATLYYLLTQREPYHADSAIEIINNVMQGEFTEPRKINKRISIELEAIILKAMEKEKEKRYQSTFDLAKDLGFYLEGKPTMARPRSVISRVIRRLKRKGLTAGILAICFIISLSAGYIAYWKIKSYQKQAYAISKKLEDCRKKLDDFDALHYMPDVDITKKFYLLREVIKTAQELLTGEDSEVKAEAYFYIGCALFRKGELEEAYNNLSRAIDLSRDPIFFLERAKVGLEIYDDKLSVRSCRAALKDVADRYKSLEENANYDIEKYLESNPDEKDWLTIYAKALVLYSKLIPEAKDLVRGLIGKVPHEKSADIWELYSRICSDRKEFDEAIEGYKEALKIKRSDYNLHIRLGNTYLFAANLLAVAHSETSIEIFNKAIDEFSEALSINSLSAVAYSRRADARQDLLKIYFTQENLEAAIEDCTKAINLKPDSAHALALRSFLYAVKALRLSEQGQDAGWLMDSMDKDLQGALRIVEDNEPILETCASGLFYKGNILIRKDKDPSSAFDESIQIFERILDKHRECLDIPSGDISKCALLINSLSIVLNQKALYLLARRKDPADEVDKSIDYLTRAIKKSPSYIESYINLAISCQHKARYLVDQGLDPGGELEKSERNLKKAIEINPRHGELYMYLGLGYWLRLDYSKRKGKSDEFSVRLAIENFTKAIDLMDQKKGAGATGRLVFLYELRGNCYSLMKEKEKAISDWQKASELHPNEKERFLRLIERAQQLD